MENKQTNWPLESKGRNWLPIIIVASLLISVAYWLIPSISKTVSSLVDQNTPKKISFPSYKKELKEAEVCINIGLATRMEEHLIRAEWDARQKGVDISEQVKEMYARGSFSVIELALSRALYGHTNSARYILVKYKRFCSEAGIQPDDKKIAEVETIIRRN